MAGLVILVAGDPLFDRIAAWQTRSSVRDCAVLEEFDVDVGIWPSGIGALTGRLDDFHARADSVEMLGLTVRSVDVSADRIRFGALAALRGVDEVRVEGGRASGELHASDLEDLVGGFGIPIDVELSAADRAVTLVVRVPLLEPVKISFAVEARRGGVALTPSFNVETGIELLDDVLNAGITIPLPGGFEAEGIEVGDDRIAFLTTFDGTFELDGFLCSPPG